MALISMFLSKLDRRWWATFNISIGIFMSTLDASVVNISLPTITQALNTNLKTVAWVVIAYLIVITGCLLWMGRLADLFGQKRIYLFGLLAFTLGSALCGFSSTIYFLIGSRMIQGLGASALMAVGPAIITTAFPEKERGQALGIVGSIVSVGFIAGPLLGGFLVDHFGWRSIFFVNLPVGAFGIFLSSRVLERDQVTGKVQVDVWGAFFLFFFLTFLLLFLNRAAEGWMALPHGWLFISLCSLILFLMAEYRSPSPLVDLHLFRRRLFISSLGTSLFSFTMNAAHTFVLPFFLQDILKFSPSKVGLFMFPIAFTVMVIAPLGGKVSDRVGVRLPATVGLMLTSLTIFSFAFLGSPIRDYSILWRQVILGIGVGLFNPANNSAIIGSLPKERIGLASSFLALSRNLGIVIGVAFAEMVVTLRQSTAPSGAGGIPSLENIRDVWEWALLIGLTAILLSWIREKGMHPSRK
jgi:EmrB/QacA subfamily drug resistance transporter